MVTIRPVKPTRSELRRYVKFGIDFYDGNPYFVPPLVMDDVNTLLPDKNPAFDFCEAQSYMAYRDDKPVGRITCIINRAVNERTGRREMRFGFVDFTDDAEVVDTLFDTARAWGRERGMTHIIGPMGFTDMDHEGMLVEGFDRVGTMATIYNYPYYPQHMERMGFVKEAEWVEFRMTVPDAIPEKYQRVADIVRRKYGLRTVEFTSRRKLRDQYGHALFDLINEAYDKLYGYSPLTNRQIDHYISQYLGIIRLDGISVIVDKDDQLVGVGISIPSFSSSLQRSRGRLWPTGWYYLLKTLYGSDPTVDLLLVAVKPEYQNKGVNALLFTDLIPKFIKAGYRHAESNPELADNEAVQKQWEYFEHEQHKRRRCYSAPID